MARPRAADDFAAFRGRMEELKREREQAALDEDENPRRRLAEKLRTSVCRVGSGQPGKSGPASI
jgi:hypothetical protein